MAKIMEILQREMEIPKPFSLFYFLFLFLTIGMTLYLCLRFKKAEVKTFKKLMLIAWIIIVILEVYKELIYSYYAYDEIKWRYNVELLPFQLCSMPFYFLPALILTNPDKHPKLFESFLSFISFPLLVAGIVVYLDPSSVFVSYVGINIQTMVHHGMQIITGIYALVWYKDKINFKYFIKSMPCFLATVSIALLLDVIVPNYYQGYFNMFFISPKMDFPVAILNIHSSDLFYPLYLTGYLASIFILSFLLFLFVKFLNRLNVKIRSHHEIKNN